MWNILFIMLTSIKQQVDSLFAHNNMIFHGNTSVLLKYSNLPAIPGVKLLMTLVNAVTMKQRVYCDVADIIFLSAANPWRVRESISNAPPDMVIAAVVILLSPVAEMVIKF